MHLAVLIIDLLNRCQIHRKKQFNLVVVELIVTELLPIDIRGLFEPDKRLVVEDFESLSHCDLVPLSTVVIAIVVIIVVFGVRSVDQFSHAQARFYEHKATEAGPFVLLNTLISAKHGIGLT